MNTWEVWADGPHVFTEWGKKDGKLQNSRVKVEAKNVGKANETSLEEQAVLEAQSLWTHKLERKYFQTEEDAANEVVFLPMLASDYAKRKKFLKSTDYPAFSQPKLDGVRCLAFWEEDKVRLISRSGKDYVLPHISKELEGILPANDVADGELYVHGLPLQQLNSLVRGSHKHPESVGVEYHVYDMVVNKDAKMPCIDRMAALKDFYKKLDSAGKVKEVLTITVDNEEEVFQAQDVFVAEGYEGGIVRLNQGEYRFGYRSKALLKVKSFIDDEFEIIGFKCGIGKFENSIIYVCVTDEGKPFTVVPKGTFEQRAIWLADGEETLGKMLKVQYAGWSDEKKPLFPIGLCIRLEEDIG